LHFSNNENELKLPLFKVQSSAARQEQFTTPSQSVPEFEIFVEEAEGENELPEVDEGGKYSRKRKAPSAAKYGAHPPKKAYLKLKKAVLKEMSLEEYYAKKIGGQQKE
jgi:hypothetical protein